MRYALFSDANQIPVITVQGQIDNGMGSSISGDAIDRVARGFFFKDQTYTFASLDGFVVFYVQKTSKWYTKSLLMMNQTYNLSSQTTDLTHYPSNWLWNCVVETLPRSDLVTCTRQVSSINNY